MTTTIDYFVPYSARDASIRERVHAWATRPTAVRNGSITIHPPNRRIRRPPTETSIVVRHLFRTSRGRNERDVLRRAGLGIYELDDGLPWDDGRLPGLGAAWKRPFRRSRIADRAGRAADRIIVGNDVLAEWANGVADDVRIIPTCVEPSDYIRSSPTGPRPIIGWLGSPATQGYLDLVVDPLVHQARRHDAEIELVGADASRLPPALGDVATVTPWSIESTASVLGRWTVGIMPLRNGVYERAKCGYKLLQYAAAGVVPVGDPVGVNRHLLAAAEGYAPEHRAEWEDALDGALSLSTAERSAKQDAGASLAAAYSFDAWEPSWRSAVGLDPVEGTSP